MTEAAQRVTMPPPVQRRSAVTVVALGECPIDQFLGSGERRGKGLAAATRRRRQSPPPADVVMRDTSRDDEQDPDPGSASSRRRPFTRNVSTASIPEDEVDHRALTGEVAAVEGTEVLQRSLHTKCRQ